MTYINCSVVNSRIWNGQRIVRKKPRFGGCAISVESLLNSLDGDYDGWIFCYTKKTTVWTREQVIYLLESRDWYPAKDERGVFLVIEREEFGGELE